MHFAIPFLHTCLRATRVGVAHIAPSYSVPELGLYWIEDQEGLERQIERQRFIEPFATTDPHILESWYEYEQWLPWEATSTYRLPPVVHRYLGTHFRLRYLAAGLSATVFSVKVKPQIILRYSMWCRSEKQPADPAIKMFFFHKMLGSSGIAPRVTYISPSVPGPPSLWHMPGKLVQPSCGPNAQIRLMVMERSGMSLNDIIGLHHQLPWHAALRLTISAVRLEQQLHIEFGVVHQDIHAGNILIGDNREYSLSTIAEAPLRLIDFERAMIVTPKSVTDNGFGPVNPARVFAINSPWEMQSNHIYSFRDDLYRTMQLLPHLLHGDTYIVMLERYATERGGESFVGMKLDGDCFELNSLFDDSSLNPLLFEIALSNKHNDASNVRSTLTWIMRHITSTDVFDKPDYGYIIRQLSALLAK